MKYYVVERIHYENPLPYMDEDFIQLLVFGGSYGGKYDRVSYEVTSFNQKRNDTDLEIMLDLPFKSLRAAKLFCANWPKVRNANTLSDDVILEYDLEIVEVNDNISQDEFFNMMVDMVKDRKKIDFYKR